MLSFCNRVGRVSLAAFALAVAGAAAPARSGDLFGELRAVPKAVQSTIAAAQIDSTSAATTDAGWAAVTDSPVFQQALKDQEAKPLPGQQIELCQLVGDTCVSQVTDADGYYQFQGLKSGTYRVQTMGSDGSLLKSNVTIQEDAMKQLQIFAK